MLNSKGFLISKHSKIVDHVRQSAMKMQQQDTHKLQRDQKFQNSMSQADLGAKQESPVKLPSFHRLGSSGQANGSQP